MLEIAFLYRIEFDDVDEYYIGSTGNLRQRQKSHLHQLRHGIHRNSRLQELYSQGKVPKFNVYATGSRDEMYDEELREIEANLSDPNMLNVGLAVKGGDNLTRNPNKADIVRRMTESVILRYRTMTPEQRQILSDNASGSNNPMFGKVRSSEFRAAMSALKMGHSDNKGIRLSKEHRKKISDRAKLRVGDKNSFYGKTHSAETRKILSDKAKGQAPTRFKSIEIDGVRYTTFTEAAKALGVVVATITHRAKSKNPLYKGYIVIETKSG